MPPLSRKVRGATVLHYIIEWRVSCGAPLRRWPRPVTRSSGPLDSGMVAGGGQAIPGGAEEPADDAVAGEQRQTYVHDAREAEAMELQRAWARWLEASLLCEWNRQQGQMLRECADLHLSECMPWIRMRIHQWRAHAAAVAARKRAAELLRARRAAYAGTSAMSQRGLVPDASSGTRMFLEQRLARAERSFGDSVAELARRAADAELRANVAEKRIVGLESDVRMLHSLMADDHAALRAIMRDEIGRAAACSAATASVVSSMALRGLGRAPRLKPLKDAEIRQVECDMTAQSRLDKLPELRDLLERRGSSIRRLLELPDLGWREAVAGDAELQAADEFVANACSVVIKSGTDEAKVFKARERELRQSNGGEARSGRALLERMESFKAVGRMRGREQRAVMEHLFDKNHMQLKAGTPKARLEARCVDIRQGYNQLPEELRAGRCMLRLLISKVDPTVRADSTRSFADALEDELEDAEAMGSRTAAPWTWDELVERIVGRLAARGVPLGGDQPGDGESSGGSSETGGESQVDEASEDGSEAPGAGDALSREGAPTDGPEAPGDTEGSTVAMVRAERLRVGSLVFCVRAAGRGDGPTGAAQSGEGGMPTDAAQSGEGGVRAEL